MRRAFNCSPSQLTYEAKKMKERAVSQTKFIKFLSSMQTFTVNHFNDMSIISFICDTVV